MKRADAYIAMEQYEHAIKDCNAALKLNVNEGYSYKKAKIVTIHSHRELNTAPDNIAYNLTFLLEC